MKLKVIGLILLIIGIVIFVDQFRIHGRLYEFVDINNHETFALMFLSSGLSFIIASLLKQNKNIKLKKKK